MSQTYEVMRYIVSVSYLVAVKREVFTRQSIIAIVNDVMDKEQVLDLSRAPKNKAAEVYARLVSAVVAMLRDEDPRLHDAADLNEAATIALSIAGETARSLKK